MEIQSPSLICFINLICYFFFLVLFLFVWHHQCCIFSFLYGWFDLLILYYNSCNFSRFFHLAWICLGWLILGRPIGLGLAGIIMLSFFWIVINKIRCLWKIKRVYYANLHCFLPSDLVGKATSICQNLMKKIRINLFFLVLLLLQN